jgi:hypothetical protein
MHHAIKAIAAGVAVGVAFAGLSLIPGLMNLWSGLGVELTPAVVRRPIFAGAIGFLVGFLLAYCWPAIRAIASSH